MFGSKYIFETRETRFYRYFKNTVLFLFSGFFIYIATGYFFLLFSDFETSKAQEKFFKASPDLVVIFTGDSGRIPYGIALAKKYKQSNVFITGVYNKNSVQTLLKPLEISDSIDPDLLEIDYYARNTVENCLSTLRYLREKNGYSQILIVSHDYHIPRIKSIFETIKTENDPYHFYYSGLKNDYSYWRNLLILYKEVYKFLRTYAFLMIWDSEVENKQLHSIN